MRKKTEANSHLPDGPRMYGYARVSTHDQDLTIQREALKKAGCSVVRSEKVTGTTRAGRNELETLLAFMRRGDTLVITRIDRLARSLRDLQNIVHELKEKGIDLKATEQPIDTSSPAGKAFLDMLGVFAEFETNLRSERQMEGIRAAQAAGRYKACGRPAFADREKVASMLAQGLGIGEIASRLGVHRVTISRVKGELIRSGRIS